MARSNLGMAPADTGSNYHFGDRMKKAKPPRSVFDLTHLSTMTIQNGGIVYPLGTPIETVPGDDFDISVTSLLRFLPQTVPLYSRQRLYIYAFYSRMSDLWENAESFIKKGLNGNKILQIPTLHTRPDQGQTNIQVNENSQTVKEGSLGDMLGLPIGLNIYKNAEESGYNEQINALPFMMYTRIWRDYFCNPNLFLTINNEDEGTYNEALFPDNDDKFRLDNNGIIISFKEKNAKMWWDMTSNDGTLPHQTKYGINFTNWDEKGNPTNTSYMRMGLFFQNWADDRFTDALPFPQRGNTPTLEAEFIINELFKENSYAALRDLEGSLMMKTPIQIRTYDSIEREWTNWTNVFNIIGNNVNPTAAKTIFDAIGDEYQRDGILQSREGETDLAGGLGIKGSSLNAILAEEIRANSTITLNKLRELAINQTELEKTAYTDGSYTQFIETFFGEIPRNSKNYKPELIGGCYTDIHFTEVLQTGTNTQQNPLGEYGGHGIGGTDGEYIGHLHCDDYGYIMFLACIAPDTYYSQGLNKIWTRSLQSDIYLPERARLGLQPILNEEIFVSDTMSKNKGLFGYNMPFDDLRYKANEIHGKIADYTNQSFGVYTQARHFEDTPALNYKFDEMRSHPELNKQNQPDGGVRKDYLAAQTEIMCTAQFKFNIRAVRPIPYKAEPAAILN